MVKNGPRINICQRVNCYILHFLNVTLMVTRTIKCRHLLTDRNELTTLSHILSHQHFIFLNSIPIPLSSYSQITLSIFPFEKAVGMWDLISISISTSILDSLTNLNLVSTTLQYKLWIVNCWKIGGFLYFASQELIGCYINLNFYLNI